MHHTYADTAVVDVAVTDDWQLDYEVSAEGQQVISDRVEVELPTVAIEDFEIRELQAVRTGP